jgi:hypothetical protein
MSEETTEERCANCKRKNKLYRFVRDEIIWVDEEGKASENGVIKLTIFGPVGPICRKCMLEAIEYLHRQVELGKALVPRSNRTKRFKVIGGGA